MKRSKKTYLIVFCLMVFVSGCVTTSKKAFQTNESQVALRAMQTRAFDTSDKKMMLQTIISAMQDLDFVIEKTDSTIGSVTGAKYLGYSVVNMTVTVRPRGDTQLLVRANCQCGIKSIEDPETYQDFFNVLEKALFLTAHQVD